MIRLAEDCIPAKDGIPLIWLRVPNDLVESLVTGVCEDSGSVSEGAKLPLSLERLRDMCSGARPGLVDKVSGAHGSEFVTVESILVKSSSKEEEVIGCNNRGLRSRVALGLRVCVALLLIAQSSAPQTASMFSQNIGDSRAQLGDSGTQDDQCNGPMGAYLPECQSSGGSMGVTSTRRSNSGKSSLPEATDDSDSSRQDRGARREDLLPRVYEPEPPSEFQRFVALSVGRVLPIFGATLFENAPSTFAPLDRVPVTAEYVIGPGDEILLRVWGQVALNRKLQVDRSGAVYIPQVGNVNVGGLQFKQLQDYLKTQLGRIFRNFDLSVGMGDLRSIQVYVTGHARVPGTYTVSSLSTLVNVLFASGGPSTQGSMRRIQLKRGLKESLEFDLYDLLLDGDKSRDARLLPEDVIFIPPVGAQIALAGSVKNPAIYELKDERTVSELLDATGGLSPIADLKRATIERIKDGVAREVLDLDLTGTGLKAELSNGDVLQFRSIVPRFENTVTLRGNVANPGRFSWRPGMRLRDLIPDKESLVTRDYWKKRNLLGSAPLPRKQFSREEDDPRTPDIRAEQDPRVKGDYRVQGNRRVEDQEERLLKADYLAERRIKEELSPEDLAEIGLISEARSTPSETKVGIDVADINWSYAVIERQSPGDLKSELVTFHLGKLILENDDRQNLELRSGDIVTVFSQQDIRVPEFQQTRTVRLEGEFNSPGIYTVSAGETLGQIIQKAGGMTPQAYLFGAEFTRKSTREEQQKRLRRYIEELEQETQTASRNRLANAASADESTKLSAEIESQKKVTERLRALESNGRIVLGLQPESHDVANISGITLEDGDRLVVPSRPATINVMGAVYNPNAFIFRDGGEVRDYVQMAGGVTRSADNGRAYVIRADGSVLSRDYASNFQRIRLNPGDSVVVPEQVLKTSFMTGLRNWSQVVSQFGIAAAAINVLR